MNHVGAQAETYAAAHLDANGEKKVEASDGFTGLSPSQVEALYTMFKDRERKEKMSGLYLEEANWSG